MNHLLSLRLQQLQASLESGDRTALPGFWDEVKRAGTPLIEPADSDNCLVTFLWRADEGTRNVAVIQDWGADGIREHMMTLLPNTDVWYKTRRMRSDTRTTYQLSPSTSPLATDPGPYQTDPLNPRTYMGYLSEEGNHIIFSYLELPNAPAQPWKTAKVAKGAVELHEPINDGRRVWVYTPATSLDSPCPLLVAFDGRLYKDLLGLPAMLDYLIAEKRMAPTIALMIDNPNRGEDLPCNPVFADYVANQLVGWVRAHYPVTGEAQRTVVTGSSFGGLAAAYLGLHYSHIFGTVLSQTGWFRWHPEGDPEFEWLARQFAEQPKLPLRFYLDVGNLEIARMNDDGPSQVVANRHLRTVLRAKGYPVDYVEYSGGHDSSSMGNSLIAALGLLLGPAE